VRLGEEKESVKGGRMEENISFWVNIADYLHPNSQHSSCNIAMILTEKEN